VRRAALVGLLALVLCAPPAHAAFPGTNGKIAFHTDRDGNNEIYLVNPGGGGLVRLTSNSASDSDPAWSPDGSQIVFVSNRDAGNFEIYKMNADGTGQTRLTNNPAFDADPNWSPDGTQIVFTSDRDGNFEIYKMNADGTGQTRVTNNPAHDGFPAWSPDGTKIAFQSDRDGNDEIYTMNADGTAQTNRTNNLASDTAPSWSPDGTQIAFASTRFNAGDIFSMNADGTSVADLSTFNPPVGDAEHSPAWSPNGTLVAATFAAPNDNLQAMSSLGQGGWYPVDSAPSGKNDEAPDWQPLVHSYARPKGATPIRDALVPAYQPCGSPDTSHQGTLASGSCNPPSPASSYLTVGTPDFNGQAANSIGSVRMDVFCNGGAVGETPPCSTTPGDQLDGRLAVSITDVRCAGTGGGCAGGALADYTDDLLFQASARVTDKNNGGFGGNATLSDFQLRFTVPCTGTASTSVGSTCSASTSIDAILGGGAIVEQKRAIWQLNDVQLWDGGADGVATTRGDNTLFAVSGLFFP
jgi:WD40-like Beta Propeller Repeat